MDEEVGLLHARAGRQADAAHLRRRGRRQAIKAEKADRVDLHASRRSRSSPTTGCVDDAFASPKKVTNANPFIDEYAWGSKVLVDFKNSKGQRLQGTLTLPANYQPGKKYPMLVYFYEKLSNTHHTFAMPQFDDRPHFAEYASDGYLVLQPDIVYEIGKPGSSALDCVTSGDEEGDRDGLRRSEAHRHPGAQLGRI